MPTASGNYKPGEATHEERLPTPDEMGAFLRFVRLHYPGSLKNAFHEIDLFKSGRISHVEFKSAAKFFKGDVLAIFRALHRNKAGNLTESEFMLLEGVQFITYVKKQSLNSLEAVFKQLDLMNTGIIKKDDFIAGIRDYDGDAEAVFTMLDRKGRNYIGIQDFMALDKAIEFCPIAKRSSQDQAVEEAPMQAVTSQSPRAAALWRPGQGVPKAQEPPGVRDLHEEHELEELIEGATDDCWVIVEFTASWSAACVAMRDALDHIARERYEAVVVRVDVDMLPETAARHGATRVPSYAIFIGGRKDMEFAGASERKLREVVANCAAPRLVATED